MSYEKETEITCFSLKKKKKLNFTNKCINYRKDSGGSCAEMSEVMI